MLKITDKSFRYTPSFNTDLRKKFRKLSRNVAPRKRNTMTRTPPWDTPWCRCWGVAA